MSDSLERIRRVVAEIPRGRVMTYGSVAAAAGMPGAARTVGYAMRKLGRTVPWQRVLGLKNPRTAHSTIGDPRGKAEQMSLLQKEGIRFDARGGISLRDFGFVPSLFRSRARERKHPPKISTKSHSTKSHMTKSHMTKSHMTKSHMTKSHMTKSCFTKSHSMESHSTKSHSTKSRFTKA